MKGYKKWWSWLGAISFATVFLLSGMIKLQAKASDVDYEIYPKPQSISYGEGSFIIQQDVNLVYEEGIDEATRARMDEVLAIKNLNASVSDAFVEGKTNVLVGIKGSEGYVDKYMSDHYTVQTAGLFEKNDSYFLASDHGTILTVGTDTDAAFYGITTLYHIFNQMESFSIRNFTAEDFSDVASRGFIEGYYGNPWSTEDRIELMKWGGYYKLNSYFYAPKDDPKHNGKWREPYSAEEIETKIKPLAEAGNASKTRFVFALHPYMNSPIRYNSEENYQADLKIMQDKFAQVIEAGVRQIAVLADDAGNVGGDNYVKTLTDMTAWLEKMRQTYPDLKLTLPFCPQEYGGYGESYYSRFPENIQIVMTGGRIWGEVSTNFTDRFTANVGRGPYMWVNWPCTDNSKKHLIMGGNSTFLHPGVSPEKIQGIVLNPMQQSEPSKAAIFANAVYSWNIWETKEEAEQAWTDSFKYVDSNSPIETPASNALRELSKHMINQNMDSRVTPLEESVELKKKLDPFKEALSAGTEIEDAVTEDLIHEFTVLQNAAVTYRNQSGATRLRDQIVYWLNSWDDTSKAAISYLNAIKAAKSGNTSALMNEYTNGQKAFAKSKTYSFHYVDHLEYAEVGVQHIVPFIKAMDSYLTGKVAEIANPNAVTKTYISNRFTNPSSGEFADLFDGNDATYVQFMDPNMILKDDYIGVKFNKGITVESIRFLMGGGKNHFYRSKLEYTQDDGATWTEVSSEIYEVPKGEERAIEIKGLGLTGVTGIRLITTADNGDDSWLMINSIDINQKEDVTNYPISGIEKSDDIKVAQPSKPLANAIDGNEASEAWLQKNDANSIPQDAWLKVDLGAEKEIGEVTLVQGLSAASDIIDEGAAEYSTDGNSWTKFGDIAKANKQTIKGAKVSARYVRIRNTKTKNVWWRVNEISVGPGKEDNYLYTNITTDIQGKVNETGDEFSLTPGTVTLEKDQYIGLKLDNIKELTQLATDIDFDAHTSLKLQISKNTLAWEDAVPGALKKDARYIKVMNTGNAPVSDLSIGEFKVASREFGEMRLMESNVPVADGWGDTRNNGLAFDGNMSTTTKLGGNPQNGQYAIYDLGQPIQITSLRTYVADSEKDFIRDAKFQISEDKINWTDAFEIGDGIKDTDRDGAVINSDVFQNVDSNYPNVRYEGNDGLHLTGRYLRILFTADFPDRAVVMNEIVVNRGAYIPVENNRDYIGSIEERGHQPSFMNDNDLSTTYKSSEKNGSIAWNISEPDGLKAFRVIQSGSAKGTTVKAVFCAGDVETEKDLGSLNQAINEYLVPDIITRSTGTNKLVQIKIEWGDQIPEIAEIITLKTAQAVDKAELNAKIREIQNTDTSGWTNASADRFRDALAVAKEVADNNFVSQESVNSAFGSLADAFGNRIEKYNTTDLEALVKGAATNDTGIYSSSTFAKYSYALADAKTALDNKDNLSVERGTAIYSALSDAANALEYSVGNRELGQVALEKAGRYQEQNYTANSFEVLTNAKNTLTDLVNQDLEAGGTRVHPDNMAGATEALKDAVAGLVDVTELRALVQAFDKVEPTLYTADTYAEYQAAAEAGRALLMNGRKEEIALAAVAIIDAKAKLNFASTVDLNTAIQAAEAYQEENYTKLTFEALKQAIQDAKAIPGTDDAENKEHIQRLNSTINNLVSIEGINAKLAEAAALDLSKYTKPSVDALNAAAAAANKLKENGTVEELRKAAEELDKAISGLSLTADEMEAYRQSVKLITDKENHTEQTYQAYKKAYDELMALPDNASYEQFILAKQAYETALSNLVYIEADYSAVEEAKKKVPADLSAYTPESVAKLKYAIDSVEYGLKVTEQEKVNKFAEAIKTAIDGLVKKPDKEQPLPGGDGSQGGAGPQNGSGSQGGGKPNQDDAVKTGDEAAVMPYIVLMMLSFAGVWLFHKRKNAR